MRAGTPRCAHSSTREKGAAAPPTSTPRRRARALSWSRSRRAWSMVGTTERRVARSQVTAARTASGSKRGWRRTARRATRQRVRMERPPTWQTGMTRSQRSPSIHPRFAALARAAAAKARRERTAPLGRPLVPEVATRARGRSGETGRRGGDGTEARGRRSPSRRVRVGAASARRREASAVVSRGWMGTMVAPRSSSAWIASTVSTVFVATRATREPGQMPSPARAARTGAARAARSAKEWTAPSATSAARDATAGSAATRERLSSSMLAP